MRIRLDGALGVSVLNLDELIAVKARAGRLKDLAALPVLEATRDELQRRG